MVTGTFVDRITNIFNEKIENNFKRFLREKNTIFNREKNINKKKAIKTKQNVLQSNKTYHHILGAFRIVHWIDEGLSL